MTINEIINNDHGHYPEDSKLNEVLPIQEILLNMNMLMLV